MALDEKQVNDVFAKTLDFVQASRTPHDGGLTEAAVTALREMAFNDPAVKARFGELVDQHHAKLVEAQAARDAAANVVKQQETANAQSGPGNAPAQPAHATQPNSGPQPTVTPGGGANAPTTGQTNAAPSGGTAGGV